jgi:hypothetical protein
MQVSFMYVRAALCRTRFDSRRTQVESFYAKQNRFPKRWKRLMCREKKKKKLFLSLCFFLNAFAFVCVPITCEVLGFENLRVGVGMERKCLIFGHSKVKKKLGECHHKCSNFTSDKETK